ncbi:hypothetical protein ABMA27_010404 [Loxostege sticticalis]|uniref:Endonuclease/exonuclease/phosphatase domain-containing protein n=1 Tax=Loxostege sticticalis TaxID=481309 RepID=A0ABR3H5K5_LOXSC
MKRLLSRYCGMDRASPQNDAHRPTSVTSMQGLPDQGRVRLKTLVPDGNIKVRFATLKVGTLTGKTKELADLLTRRRIDFACLQETRWQGSKSRNRGEGYKLMYTGSKGGRNGVAIIISHDHLDNIVGVKRFSDRRGGKPMLHYVSAYAPQVGCSRTEKIFFWIFLDDILQEIPSNEITILGSDLNGHVGTKCEPCQRVHGDHVNTFFSKKHEHLITYKSGSACSQIDFVLLNRFSHRKSQKLQSDTWGKHHNIEL